MNIEIDIRSALSEEDVYELRNHIQELDIKGLQIGLKEKSPAEGEMGFLALLGLVGTFLGEAALNTVAEEGLKKVYAKLEPGIIKWLEKRKKQGKADIEIITSVKDGELQNSFVTNYSGTSILDNFSFSIDVDRTRVLLIGNGEFEHNFPTIQPVKGNVEDFGKLLTDPKIVGIPRENITALFNKQSGEIEEKLLLISKEPNIETLIIYFAGHGCRTDSKKLFLVASNTRKVGDHIISGIDFDFIKNVVLKQSTASQKIIILDACHSGVATQGHNDLVTDFDVEGTYIFTSSSGDEASYYEAGRAHTFFSGELINVLSRGLDNNQEYLSLKDIYENVRTELKQKKFPEPRDKSELNIPLANFNLARNSSYSYDRWKQKAAAFVRVRKLDLALNEYRAMETRYPNDASIKIAIESCEQEKKFMRLVMEGDSLFQQKKYAAAVLKYEAAIALKEESSVLDKLEKSREYAAIMPVSDSSTDNGLHEYELLFEVFYEDKVISITERAQLKRLQQKYHLSDSDVLEIEEKVMDRNKIKEEVVPPTPPPIPVPPVPSPKPVPPSPTPIVITTDEQRIRRNVMILCGLVAAVFALNITSSVRYLQYVTKYGVNFTALLLPIFSLLLIPTMIILLLRRNRWGWVLGVFVSTNSILTWLVSTYFRVVDNGKYPEVFTMVLGIAFFVVYVILLPFLLQPGTRQYFHIPVKWVARTLIAAGIYFLSVFYFAGG